MKDEALGDTHTHVWEQLITLMEREIQLLGDFTAAAGEMRESLHRKDWSSLEAAWFRWTPRRPSWPLWRVSAPG